MLTQIGPARAVQTQSGYVRGTGEVARAAYPVLDHSGVLVAACIDERLHAQNKLFWGSIPILSLENALKCHPDAVLLALRDVDAIYLPKLAALGIPETMTASLDFADLAARAAGPDTSIEDRFRVTGRISC